jgi:hypothetical protein
VFAQQRSRIVVRADSAFASGDVALADSLYYVAARQRPRDPEARAALGRYLAAQGKAKVAIVLLEEARMFGGDPAELAKDLVPEYEFLGEWRALLTLPGSPLSTSERRRAAWLSEHAFGMEGDGNSGSTVGAPKGDTIARVAVRIAGRAAVASIVAADTGFVVGSRIAGSSARHFGDDSSVVAFDSMTVAGTRFVNVPATIGQAPSTMSVGVAALGRLLIVVNYSRGRVTFARTDAGIVEARYPLVRTAGQLWVLDRGGWVGLGEYAAGVARASKTLIVDVAGGEVRIRP